MDTSRSLKTACSARQFFSMADSASSTVQVSVLMVIIFSSVDAGKHQFTQCQSDYDCDDGYFCYTASKICSECIDCSGYHRQPGEKICSRSPQECGQCLNGYEERSFTENMTKDYCETENGNHYLYHVIAIALIVVASLFGILFICYKKGVFHWIKKRMRAGPSLVPANANKTPNEFNSRDPTDECSTELSSAQLLPPALYKKVSEEMIPLTPSAPFNPAFVPGVPHKKETEHLSQSRIFRQTDTPPPAYNSTLPVGYGLLPPNDHAPNIVPQGNDRLSMYNAHPYDNRLHHNRNRSGSETNRLPLQENNTRNAMPPDGDNSSDGSHGDGSYGENASGDYKSRSVFVNNIVIHQIPMTQNSVNTANNNM